MFSSALLIITRANELNKYKCLQNLRLLIYQKKVLYSAESTSFAPPPHEKQKPVSKAMKAYLERAQHHDEFMKSQVTDYNIGKRHLANMMGEDSDSFNQQQIEDAIQYLFPSGLYDKKARPIMKPPQEVFPQRKAAEFDGTGKPYHSMFYTGLPNFFKLLYDIVELFNELNAFEDRMKQPNTPYDSNLRLDLAGSIWIPKDFLEDFLLEKITDVEYDNFVNAMDRLEQHPYSYMKKDFILKYRKSLMNETNKYEIMPVKYDENGKEYVTIYECLRKTSRGSVTIRSPGTGKLTINGMDITYFDNIQSREQKIFITLTALHNIIIAVFSMRTALEFDKL